MLDQEEHSAETERGGNKRKDRVRQNAKEGIKQEGRETRKEMILQV